MSEETGLQAIIDAGGMAIMASLANLEKTKKEIEKDDKELRAQLTALCDKYGVKSIDNDYVRISFVEGSFSVSIDLAAFKKKEPEVYDEIMHDFPASIDVDALEKAEPDTYDALVQDYRKVSTRKGYVRITVK